MRATSLPVRACRLGRPKSRSWADSSCYRTRIAAPLRQRHLSCLCALSLPPAPAWEGAFPADLRPGPAPLTAVASAARAAHMDGGRSAVFRGGRGRGGQQAYKLSGHITEDEAVLSFMRALVDHQKRCEREGKYDEAQATARRVAELRATEEQKRRRQILEQHAAERAQAETAYLAECEQHAELWDAKEAEYDMAVEEQLRRLAEAQRARLDDFAGEAAARAPRRPQPSKALLAQRARQAALAKLGQYEEAEAVQRLTDRLEAAESAAARETYEAETAFREQQLRAKQQQELEGLLERAARGREQLRAARLADQERRQRRFRNVLSELEGLQRLELAQLDSFLRAQALAGKRVPLPGENVPGLAGPQAEGSGFYAGGGAGGGAGGIGGLGRDMSRVSVGGGSTAGRSGVGSRAAKTGGTAGGIRAAGGIGGVHKAQAALS